MDFKEYREVGQVMEAYDRCSSFCLKVKELLLEQRKKSGEVLCDKAWLSSRRTTPTRTSP